MMETLKQLIYCISCRYFPVKKEGDTCRVCLGIYGKKPITHDGMKL